MPSEHITPSIQDWPENSREDRYSLAIYPLHAVFLAGTIPLFLGAALSDFAYVSSFHIQWSNFSSWLIVGGMVFATIALLFSIIDLFRPRRRVRSLVLYTVLLLVAWILGFINSLIHAQDAWESMPTGLILSVVVTVLVCVATWLGFCAPRFGGPK